MSSETVTLTSTSGSEHKLDKSKCALSETLTQLFEDVDQTDEKIDLKFDGKLVNIVVDYINTYYTEREKASSEGRVFLPEKALDNNQDYEADTWESQFVPENVSELLGLAELTHFLRVKPLTNLVFSTIGRQMANKRPDEIVSHFDLEPLEEEIYEFLDENNRFEVIQ